MAGSVKETPGFDLQPSAKQVTLSTNYLKDFDFTSQYLPDLYEQEFERYGNRSVASFLRMVSAELPTNSDLIKWTEQGRLHIKYTNVATTAALGDDTATFTVSDTGITEIGIRVGNTVLIDANDGTGSNRGIVTGVSDIGAAGNPTFTVAYYEADGQGFAAAAACSVMIYGSEFKKGTNGMAGAIEPEPLIFENSPVIMKDHYQINGSDMAQIGWIEVTGEDGVGGYLWYLKAEHDTRMRFDDYLETSILEAVPNENTANAGTAKGMEGVFYAINDRGNVYDGVPDTLPDFDNIVQRLDKQGAIEENAMFLNRATGFAIDDMLAAQNNYGSSGTSYGLFDNDENMALNLGFSGFRRGYDFYKTDWKYLNDPTMRGGLASETLNGMIVPAGSTTVYDNVLGKNAQRPFLHVRYRASETENRRYKTWITGSAGGASTSDLDAMEVHFLTERSVCVLGANNFFLLK
jgi:hypothetical protein